MRPEKPSVDIPGEGIPTPGIRFLVLLLLRAELPKMENSVRFSYASSPTREFPAHPRVAWSLAGSHWLACGTAALAFDPLCGDGTGHAIREAILAAAVLRAIQRGANVDELLNHYIRRGWLPASNVTCLFAMSSTSPAELDLGGRLPRRRFAKVWHGVTTN